MLHSRTVKLNHVDHIMLYANMPYTMYIPMISYTHI